MEGYTHAEIAQTLQLPLGTVKTITRRGVQQVRDELCQGLAAIPA